MNQSNFYKVGGTLDAQNPTYVKRQADENFYEGLRAGDFCYILNSRQMGKSSLGVHTMQRLKAQGYEAAFIDLTNDVGTATTADEWYYSLANSIKRELKINIHLSNWWDQYPNLTALGRFSQFIETVLFLENSKNIIILIDEINNVKSQPFSLDDFFAFIRSCFNNRVNQPDYKRLTFAIFGVATPSDLIEDLNQTPFNIGREIKLQGFQIRKVNPLIEGLKTKVNNPQAVIEKIFGWTGGQPFLTQKICNLVVKEENRNPDIGKIVQTQIIENWESQDHPQHLNHIKYRILNNYHLVEKMLCIYQDIQRGKDVDAIDSEEQKQLLLSGLIVRDQNKLKTCNRIYEEVFNKGWIKEQLQIVQSDENLRKELSALGIKLCHQGHEFQGNQALKFADLSTNFQDVKVKKVMLLSCISLANLELKELKKAQEKINVALKYLDDNKEIQKIELNSSVTTSSLPQKMQALIHVYYVCGSLSREQGYLEKSLQAYIKAFETFKDVFKKRIDISNKEVLPAEIIVSIHKDLIDILHQQKSTDPIINDVEYSLIQYLFIHYTPIEKWLKSKEWKKADEETYRMMTQKMGKKGMETLVKSDFEEFPLEDLYVVNTLWEKYSCSKFGFRNQTEIWINSGGEIGQIRLAPLIKFWQAVGWLSKGKLEEIELNEINHQLQRDTPDGYLPTTGLRFQEISLFSRFASCDIFFFDSLILAKGIDI
jgi:AAA-like domain/GUN4-like